MLYIHSIVNLSVSVTDYAISITNVLFQRIGGVKFGFAEEFDPANVTPHPEEFMLVLVKSYATPSTVIFTRIVLAVASVVLTDSTGISPPVPLTLKKDLSVFSVVAPDNVLMPSMCVEIDPPAVPEIACLLKIALVDLSAPVDAGNMFERKITLKTPRV